MNDFLKLESGGRVEHISYQARGFTDDSYTPLGVSTGIVVDPTGDDDYTVGLSLAFTQRAPAATELYANGAHAARQLFEVGDTSLELEESVGVDLTFKKNTGLITGAVNLFAQEYNNYINLSQTGGEEDGLPVFSYESIDAKFVGFEAEATVHLHKALDLLIHDLNLNFQVDTVRAKNRSDDEDLPRIPPVRTIVGVDYQYKNRFGASVEGVFVEDQGRTAEFESPTGGYQLLNSSLDIKIPTSPSYQLALYLQGTNLTDQEARVHSSFIKDLAPLRGRNFLLGVRGTF